MKSRKDIVESLKDLFNEVNSLSKSDPKLQETKRHLAAAAGTLDGDAAAQMRAAIGISSGVRPSFGTVPPARKAAAIADPFPVHVRGDAKPASRVEKVLSGKDALPAEGTAEANKVPPQVGKYSEMGFAELKALTDAAGITPEGRLSKDRLIILLQERESSSKGE